MPINLAINGFGRIGRSLLRLASLSSEWEVALINDVAPLETCAYLFEFDSIFGPWPGDVCVGEDCLIVDGRPIPFHRSKKIGGLDLSHIDVVMECTGHSQTMDFARSARAAGACRVLISGPASGADVTLVIGANETAYGGQGIVSNASCTTNALGPILRVADDLFGIVGGQMTTIHCYTASQPVVDQPRGDLARSRAAALSMVPTTTSAHTLLNDILPHLAGKIDARALRVPTASVSAIDLTISLRDCDDVATARRRLKTACSASPVLGWTEKPLVSADLRGRSESLVVSGREISLAAGNLLRIFGWYDNEWGFANRLLDMARLISR